MNEQTNKQTTDLVLWCLNI